MEPVKASMKVAGIDTSKAKLDVAVKGKSEVLQVTNDAAGFAQLGAWLASMEVTRVGIEATGGYERAVTTWLRGLGLEVVVHQPAEVRAFARFKRLRAKTDKIDAALIAAATAQVDTVRCANDPLIVELAERLTAYEQVSELLAQMKTHLEHVTLEDLKAQQQAQIQHTTTWKKALAQDLFSRIKANADLARRFELLQSLPGVAKIVAASLVLRMPELGSLDHGHAASLLGVAPFAKDTGQSNGERHIAGGRARPRRMVYLAAIVAKRIDPAYKAFAGRLLKAGKKPKVTIVAVMRKLIEAANLILKRGTPWVPTQRA